MILKMYTVSCEIIEENWKNLCRNKLFLFYMLLAQVLVDVIQCDSDTVRQALVESFDFQFVNQVFLNGVSSSSYCVYF